MTTATMTTARRSRVSTAVVTGAGGALGRAIARRLAADGHVVVAADIDTDAVEATRAAVTEAGGEALAWTLDLRDPDAIGDLFEMTGRAHGGAAILVNNAAVYPSRAFLDIPVAEYDAVYQVN